jgi:hypothetical protein
MHGIPVPKPHTGVDGVAEGAMLGIAVVGAAVVGAAVVGAAVLGAAVVGAAVLGSAVGSSVGSCVGTVVGAEVGLQRAFASQHDTLCRDERLQGHSGALRAHKITGAGGST